MGIPVIINETDEHILHRLYFLGSRKILTKPSKDLKEVKTKSIKKTQKHKNSNRVGCPIKTFLLSNGTSNFLSPCFPHFFFPFQMHFPSDLQSTKNAFPFRPPVYQKKNRANLADDFTQTVDTGLVHSNARCPSK